MHNLRHMPVSYRLCALRAPTNVILRRVATRQHEWFGKYFWTVYPQEHSRYTMGYNRNRVPNA